jgi:hypothetical protein
MVNSCAFWPFIYLWRSIYQILFPFLKLVICSYTIELYSFFANLDTVVNFEESQVGKRIYHEEEKAKIY